LESRPDFSVCGQATDGIDAIEKNRELRPDLVLMDLSMPRMNGIEATRIIRQETPQTDVIIITQNLSEMPRAQLDEIGAKAFVSKTKLVEDLLPTILAVSNAGRRSSPRPLQPI